MKNLICVMLAVLLLLPVFATTAFAHGHRNHGQEVKQCCAPQQVCNPQNDCADSGTCTDKCRFADENSDGICDRCNNQCADCGETRDDNADGFCDECGNCSHYADENQDGICDHQAECENRNQAATKPAAGENGHHGRRHRKHH